MTNGGFVQLPNPGEKITWNEYKKKYGIDLEEIFEVIETEGGKDIKFRKDFEKPLMISGYSELNNESLDLLPNCAYPNYFVGDLDGTIRKMTIAIVEHDSNAGWGLTIGADKTIAGWEL